MMGLLSLQLGQLCLIQFLLGGNFQAFIPSPAAAGTPCHYRELPGKGEGRAEMRERDVEGVRRRNWAGMGKSPVGRKGRGWLQGGPPNPAGGGTERHPAGVVCNRAKSVHSAGKANV